MSIVLVGGAVAWVVLRPADLPVGVVTLLRTRWEGGAMSIVLVGGGVARVVPASADLAVGVVTALRTRWRAAL